MSAARYWRVSGLSAYGGGDVELSALQLYESSSSDPGYANVALLLHADGANDSAVFVDSSSTPKIVTAYNGAKISTANSKFGGSAFYFSGPTSHARITPTADFAFGTGDFTMECWVNYSSHAGARPVGLFNGTVGVVQLYIASGSLVVETGDNAGGAGGSVPLNEWVHLAVTRASGVVRSFVNGTKVYEYIDSRSLNAPANININQYGNGVGYGGVGFVDEVRITKGVARYTTTFARPTEAFPNSATSSSATRVDQSAAISTTMPPVSGSITSLQDGDPAIGVRMAAREPGFAVQWDFGAGVAKTVSIAAPGSAAESTRFLSHFDLQSSDDGKFWTQVATLGRFPWPGAQTLVAAPVLFDSLAINTAGFNAAIAASAPVPAFSTRTAPALTLARDVEVGGPGTIYGTTKTKGTPNQPTHARVVLLHQRSKLPVRETWSDPVTGNFAFAGIDINQQFLTLAEDAAGNFRPVAASRLTPEVAP